MFAHVNGTEHLYITTNDQILSGEPVIRGNTNAGSRNSRTVATGFAPEEICRQLPHLNLAQVFRRAQLLHASFILIRTL